MSSQIFQIHENIYFYPFVTQNEVTLNNWMLVVHVTWFNPLPPPHTHYYLVPIFGKLSFFLLYSLMPPSGNMLKLDLVFFHNSFFYFFCVYHVFCLNVVVVHFCPKVSLFFFIFLVFAWKSNLTSKKNLFVFKIVVVDPPAEFKKCVWCVCKRERVCVFQR